MIKIDKNILSEYLGVIQSQGDGCNVAMASLEFDKKGCQVAAQGGSGTFFVYATLKPSAFVFLPEKMETYNINNITEFANILGTTGGIISIERQENCIVISDGKGKLVYYVLTADEYIPKPKPVAEMKVKFEKGFSLSADVFKEIIGDAKKITTKKESPRYTIEIKSNAGTITCGEKGATRIVKKFAAVHPDVRCVFKLGFDSVFTNCPGQAIKVFLLNDAPLKVESETGNIRVEYVLAPIVDQA